SVGDLLAQPFLELLGVEELKVALGHGRNIDVIKIEAKGALKGVHVVDFTDEHQACKDEEIVETFDDAFFQAVIEFQQILGAYRYAVVPKEVDEIHEEDVAEFGGNLKHNRLFRSFA